MSDQINPSRAINRATAIITVLAAGAMVVFYAASFWKAINFPLSLTFESHVLSAACKLAKGQNIYALTTLSQIPWDVCIYPPLYPALAAPFVAMWGPSFWTLRLITAISAVTTAGLLAAILRRNSCSIPATIASLVFFFGFVPVWYTSMNAKSDFFALALCALSLLRFNIEQKTQRPPWGSALICTMAFLAKQQSVVIPLTVTLYLLINRQFKRAAQFTGCWAASMAFSAGTIQIVTGGYLQHLSFLRMVQWSLLNEQLILMSLGYNAIALFIAVVAIGLFLWRATPEQRKGALLPGILLIVTMLLMAYSLGIPGAGSNHLIGAAFAFAYLLGLALTKFPKAALPIAMLSALPLHIMYDFLNTVTTDQTKLTAGLIERLPRGAAILSEDPYWELQTGASPTIVDCVSFFNVWKAHPDQLQPLIGAINQRKFAAIIMNERDAEHPGWHIWPPEAVAAVKANYEKVRDAGGNGIKQYLMLPKR